MTTDLTKAQLATILSALDERPRNPANKGEALKALAKSAERHGLTAADVLAAAPGLLDGRISPEDFRAELTEDGPQEAPQAADEAQDAAPAEDPARSTPTSRPGTPADLGGAARRPRARGRTPAPSRRS